MDQILDSKLKVHCLQRTIMDAPPDPMRKPIPSTRRRQRRWSYCHLGFLSLRFVMWVVYGVSISFHIPKSPPGEDICTLLSLVKFETGGLGVPIQFYSFEKNMLEETSETQIPPVMMTLSATCPGQLLRRSSARCWKMRRGNSELPKPKQRRLANALRRRRRPRTGLPHRHFRYMTAMICDKITQNQSKMYHRNL